MLIRLIICIAAFAPFTAFCQWAGGTTMTLDGNNGESCYVTNNAWSIAWDDTYLYLVKKGGSSTEPWIVYFDIDPVFPVTGGGNTDGSVTGTTDWGITPNCPFRADGRLYMTTSTVELLNRNNSGGWSGTSTPSMGTSGSDREVRISWSSFAGISSRPSQFSFFGFASTTSGPPATMYDQSPEDNPHTGSYATPNCEYYWRCHNTSSTNTENPFDYKSYTYLGTGGSLGTISDIYDFTLNKSGVTVNKSDKWVYNGYMVIADGAIEFDTNGDSLIVGDSLVVMSNGRFLMESATSTVWVKSHFNNRSTYSGTDVVLSDNDTARLIVAGNLWNSGDFDAQSTAVELFDHKSTQVLQTVVGDWSGSNHLYRLLLNNGAGFRLAIDDSLCVSDSLAFLEGIVSVDDGKSLRLRRTCSVYNPGGPSGSRFVDGVLVREIPTTSATTFHVGDSNRLAKIIIEPSASATGRTYAVQYHATGHQYSSSSSATRGVPGNGLDHASYLEYWSVTCPHTTDDATLTLYWTSISNVGSSSAYWDSLRVCRWVAGSTNEWLNEGFSTISGSSTDDGYVVAGTTSTTFADSFFTLGSITVNNPLPADVISFQANRTNSVEAVAKWVSASEQNCSHYELWLADEWEDDKLLAQTPGAGFSSEILSYQEVINIPHHDIILKLRQVDFDGRAEWVGIAFIPGINPNIPGIYPNPASETISLTDQKWIEPTTQIFNTVGQVVLNTNQTSNISISHLPDGMYYLILTNNGRMQTPIKFELSKHQ